MTFGVFGLFFFAVFFSFLFSLGFSALVLLSWDLVHGRGTAVGSGLVGMWWRSGLLSMRSRHWPKTRYLCD